MTPALLLQEAALCAVCETVFRFSGVTACPRCTSEQWLVLATILTRPKEAIPMRAGLRAVHLAEAQHHLEAAFECLETAEEVDLARDVDLVRTQAKEAERLADATAARHLDELERRCG